MSDSPIIAPVAKKQPRKRPLPPKPTKAQVTAAVTELVKETAVAVATGKELDTKPAGPLSGAVRNHILSLLGPDIEAARAEFADELLATGRQIIQRIQREVDVLPASTLAFTAAVMIDKSEALRSKSGTSAKGAQVAIHINSFGKDGVDREMIIRTLHGDFSAVKAEKPVSDSADKVEQSPVKTEGQQVEGNAEVVADEAEEAKGGNR